MRALQDHLVRSGLSRGVVNQRADLARRLFRRAVSHAQVPVSVQVGLSTVPGLKKGRSAARERPAVKPVPPADVETVLPLMPTPVRAMVVVQWHSGCRTGEVLPLRPCDLVTGGGVWVYRPRRHKNTYRGRKRVVFLGVTDKTSCAPLRGLVGWRKL